MTSPESPTAAAIFFFLDFLGIGKENIAPFLTSFSSFLILASVHFEIPVAANTLAQTHFSGIAVHSLSFLT